jgi:uncharacterized protein YukJ
MALAKYGVFKGRVIDSQRGSSRSPHYQLHVIDEETDRRIAVNVESQAAPSEVLYFVDNDFRHPLTARLAELPQGYTEAERKPGGVALDFIRGNYFQREDMRPLSNTVPGPDNDLNDLVDGYVQRAMGDEESLVFAFGAPWGPEAKRDGYFGFKPGAGVHDIHMNQGNSGKWEKDNGPWQDGGLLFYLAPERRWVALFLAFQSQAWHTDDTSGIELAKEVVGFDGALRILGAMVNPVGDDRGREWVLVLNTSPKEIDLAGWALADEKKTKHLLSGKIAAGDTKNIPLPAGSITLPNTGGVLSLLDAQGTKVHGVKYARKDAEREGWVTTF